MTNNLGKLSAVCAVALMGLGAATLPATADSLGVQFTGTPTATLNSAPEGVAYGYNLIDVSTSITVTGLGEFVDSSLSNISTQGNFESPIGSAGDWVYVGAGTIPANDTDFPKDALFSAEITTADASLVGTYWAFTSITPQVLAAGDYWIAVVYGDDNTPYTSTSPGTTETGISLNGGATCGLSTACSGTTGETFGANFETSDVSAPPLPAALPLFAGGLGLLGLFSGRSKRKSKNTAIAAG